MTGFHASIAHMQSQNRPNHNLSLALSPSPSTDKIAISPSLQPQSTTSQSSSVVSFAAKAAKLTTDMSPEEVEIQEPVTISNASTSPEPMSSQKRKHQQWKERLPSTQLISRLLAWAVLAVGVGALFIFIVVYGVVSDRNKSAPICNSEWWREFVDGALWVGIHGILSFAADQYFIRRRKELPEDTAESPGGNYDLHSHYKHNERVRDQVELVNYALGLGLLALFLWGPTVLTDACYKFHPETKKSCD